MQGRDQQLDAALTQQAGLQIEAGADPGVAGDIQAAEAVGFGDAGSAFLHPFDHLSPVAHDGIGPLGLEPAHEGFLVQFGQNQRRQCFLPGMVLMEGVEGGFPAVQQPGVVAVVTLSMP